MVIRCPSGRMRQDTLLSSGRLASPPLPSPPLPLPFPPARDLLNISSMEQTPADARAAPSASGPTDMATETPPSPKRPRDPSSDNKVSQRATTFEPVLPENQIRTTEYLSPVHSTQHLPMHARALHVPPPLWVGGSSLPKVGEAGESERFPRTPEGGAARLGVADSARENATDGGGDASWNEFHGKANSRGTQHDGQATSCIARGGKAAFVDGVEHVNAPSLAPHVYFLVWNRITARERERDGVEDDERETKPVGARGGPSTPPSGRDDAVLQPKSRQGDLDQPRGRRRGGTGLDAADLIAEFNPPTTPKVKKKATSCSPHSPPVGQAVDKRPQNRRTPRHATVFASRRVSVGSRDGAPPGPALRAICEMASHRSPFASQGEPVVRAATTAGEDSGSARPSRVADGGDIFGAAEGNGVAVGSAWATHSNSIVEDMRAHLDRRRLRENADLITSRRGLFGSVVATVNAILRSRYLQNVRRSLLLAVSMWSWYVFNTKTYVKPEYED
eukprot:scaffold4498_cov119-Isochrysis_galbana.AAC.24